MCVWVLIDPSVFVNVIILSRDVMIYVNLVLMIVYSCIIRESLPSQ
jgi:hypothetical protein